VLRWVYVARLCVATAILLAAVSRWGSAQREATLVATLAFAAAALCTVGSAVRSELRRSRLGVPFFALQALCDLLVVTAAVHVTGGATSQFAALYILVIASASLLLPAAGALSAAALGSALYAADALWLRRAAPGADSGVWLQLLVFAVVALGSGFVGARLRQAGAGGAELALALVRARVEAADILRNIRSGIVTVDGDGTLLYANPAASALLGLDLGGRLGRPVMDELTALAPELAESLRLATRQGIRTTRAEGTVARPAGAAPAREVRIGVTTTVAESAAHADARVAAGPRRTGTAIFSDITDSKRLEALHLRAERLGAVAELSASLAHEIKNPLASIRSAVEQLARRYAAAGIAADDDERTLASLVLRESDRLSRLLTEFLDFARAQVTRVERVELGAVARAAARTAQAHPSLADGVRVEVDVDPDAIVDGDEELLHRALFNLVLNAGQASPAGGRVRVEAQLPDAEELPGGLAFDHGAVAVHVSDDGAGIAPDILDKLFDPFFTTKAGGSGLGLAVVQRAVDAHRGVVLVEGGAAAGGSGGARFTLLLPRSAGVAPALQKAAAYLPTPVIPMKAIA
jgi:two-component system, NtrC family, sensor histidine kinase PilS